MSQLSKTDSKVGLNSLESSMNSLGRMENSSGSSFRAEEEVAGNSKALQALRELIIYPIRYSQQGQKLGIKWNRGLLLYGPPGTGKTSLVRAVVRESGAHLIAISHRTVYRSHAGEGEKVLRDTFAEASSQAKSGKPSVIFIDEIDELCPRRDSRRAQNTRIASQLFLLMDSNSLQLSAASHVFVVASTNRVDAIDPALRRTGRFDVEIEVTTPNVKERFQILKLYTKKVPLDASVDLHAIAASCNGYVGADLEALCRQAVISVDRSSGSGGIRCLNTNDWEHAKTIVNASITRGVTVKVPKVTWEDIGGLQYLKKKLKQAVEWPLKHPAAFARLGVTPYCGVLLHGPPGCSKTTIAKAVAHASQASFFSLSAAELYLMYVGEGEALLRSVFRIARLAAPSIIFFDEADAVAAKRGGNSSDSSSVGERLLSTLLTEMDGLEHAEGVLVLAATNLPHAIDVALMRPGRFDLVLYVRPPDQESRYEILQVHTREMQMYDDVNLRQVAEDTELFTGADLEGLCKKAGWLALREDMSAKVCHRHFQVLLQNLKPSLSREAIESYSSFMKTPSLASGQFKVSSQERTKGNKDATFLTTLVIVGISILLSAWTKGNMNATVLTTLAVVGVIILLSACLQYGRTTTNQNSR